MNGSAVLSPFSALIPKTVFPSDESRTITYFESRVHIALLLPTPHEEKCPLLLASSFAIFLLFFTSEPLPAPLFSSVQTAVVNSWRLVARESVTPGLEKGRQWTDFLPDSRGHSLPYDKEWLQQLPRTDHWTVRSLPVQRQRSLNKVFSLGRVSRGEMSHQKQNGDNTTGLAQILLKSGLR